MISNVALQTSETAVAAPVAGDTGETGAFDALLALSATSAQVAGSLEGAELLAGTLEDSLEASTDDDETGEDASWFLASLIPATSSPPHAVTVGAAASAPAHARVHEAGLAPVAQPRRLEPEDLSDVLDAVEIVHDTPSVMASTSMSMWK